MGVLCSNNVEHPNTFSFWAVRPAHIRAPAKGALILAGSPKDAGRRGAPGVVAAVAGPRTVVRGDNIVPILEPNRKKILDTLASLGIMDDQSGAPPETPQY